MKVYSWNSDWINAQKDIFIYSLRYRYPINTTSDMLDLFVNEIFVPEKSAKLSIAQAREYSKIN